MPNLSMSINGTVEQTFREELSMIGAIIAGVLVGGATNNAIAGIAAGIVWFLFVMANDRG